MLTIKNLSLQLGDKLLFNNVSLMLHRKEKVGIVGVNGSGKSSLLKTILGQIKPENGGIQMDGKIAYLSQEVHIDNAFKDNEGITIFDYISLNSDKYIEEWEVSKFINFLNLTHKTSQSIISELSGGQKVKVEIIKILLSEPDLLILDEPTNFLDIPTAEWLMGYLVKYPEAVLVISHDLRLMNRAIDKIWFLNEFTKQVEIFAGSYEEFIRKKSIQDDVLAKRLKQQDKEYVRLHKVAERKKSGVGGKGAIAARIRGKAEDLKEQTTKEREGLRKSMKMNLKFTIKEFPGREILRTEGISKTYEPLKVLKSVDLEIERGDRVVIIGRNGAGKSTLLKILTGNTQADSGSFKWGLNVDVGYYAQEYEGIQYDKTVIENMREDRRLDDHSMQDLRKVLGSFMFSGEKVGQKVGSLSGGEKTRLALAKIFAGGYNTLILDEPTTYLDPMSQVVLQDALINYEGTLIIVSHVPDFVNAVNPNKVLLMPEEEFRLYDEKFLDLVGLTV